MGTRIVFEFVVSVQFEAEAWDQVVAFLEDQQAKYIGSPEGEPPYVITAVLPEEIDVQGVLKQLRRMKGVGRAEEDARRDIL